MRLDHVIYGTADLDVAQRRIETELGLEVLAGGHHVGQGSHNRIVPLGDGYLELMAIDDPQEAATNPFGEVLLEVLAVEGLVAWAVLVDDVHAIAQRLGTPLVEVRRETLGATVTGVQEALREPTLPFFIGANERGTRPGTARDAGGLTWIEVAGDEARLRDWLGDAELPVRVVPGDPAVHAIGIGEREFRP
ncbi:VOC family protein [Solirubrobacter soli]|uniref:VOC family protein n=1 Tax=Solirubrobacter soli TaxID=363832 RepID=UPI00041826F4|nr:VOC family protein [Solirubrobacter soli]